MPVTWPDEKLILLYCRGEGSNSRPSAHRSFKHDQGVLCPNHSPTALQTLQRYKFIKVHFGEVFAKYVIDI